MALASFAYLFMAYDTRINETETETETETKKNTKHTYTNEE